MQIRDHDQKGKAVWLQPDEIDLLLDGSRNTEQWIAFALGARCGLRTKEIIEVTANDVVEGPSGTMLRVWKGKGNKYRETPLPQQVETTIKIYAEQRPESFDAKLVPRKTRTLRKWVTQASDRVRAATGDEGWRFVSPHDLRRSWGTLLVQENVEHGLIMEWGGWESWQTFRKHYLGQYTPDRIRQQREKVAWLQ